MCSSAAMPCVYGLKVDYGRCRGPEFAMLGVVALKQLDICT